MGGKSRVLRRVWALVVATALAAAPAAAQSPPVVVGPAPTPTPSTVGTNNNNNVGRDVGIGLGVAVGVAILGVILHRLQNPPPPPPPPPELPPEPAASVEQTLARLPPPPPPGPTSGQRVFRPHGRSGGGNNGGGNSGGNGSANSGASRGGVPPRGETRFVPDEVITQFSSNASPQAIGQIATRFNLTQLESAALPLVGVTVYRWHINGSRSVPSVIRALLRDRLIASVQPNYLFALQQQAPPAGAGADDDTAQQYALAKMQIPEAHKIATGRGILVAVIDSAVDESHPDLDGAIAKSFDALGNEGKPHKHGTAMAGAIASRGKLTGIAVGAQLLVARAFGDSAEQAQGTSLAIYKSLQWAADNHARVVNMSFAGPADPMLHRVLAAAYGKDMVLVAAAGNAGPKSPPLYPGADEDVIAVTATDDSDHLFKLANQGRYIAVAAPGVQVLALAPDDSYDVTTGTSVAAAEVSGIAALMLEHKPSLRPADLRAILMTAAKPLGPKRQNPEFGAGLVNAYRALLQEDKSVSAVPGQQQHAGR